jgi:quercetin dioxygenase-like cupin family protein
MVQHRNGCGAGFEHLANGALTLLGVTMPSAPLIIKDPKEAPEGWNEPEGRGVIFWKTLFSRDMTPTESMSAGIVVLPQNGFLALHRHAPAEIYHMIEGTADVTIDGKTTTLTVGDTVFIPPLVEHGIRNTREADCRFLYVFPTDSFGEIEYMFS